MNATINQKIDSLDIAAVIGMALLSASLLISYLPFLYGNSWFIQDILGFTQYAWLFFMTYIATHEEPSIMLKPTLLSVFIVGPALSLIAVLMSIISLF